MADSLPEVYSEESEDSNQGTAEVVKHLDLLGLKLSKTRSEAIAGRENSGVEQEWLEDEEFYEGIDDANRAELKAWKGKPLGQATPQDDDTENTGSTIFLNITRAYVDATAARIADMLFPAEERGYKFKITPVPELIDAQEGKITPDQRSQIVLDNPTNSEKQDTASADLATKAKDEIKVMTDAAKKAEDQVWDWHVESGYQAHNRRVVEDSAKVGTGVLKGPIPTKKTKTVFVNGKLDKITAIKPASVRIFYRNFYPDPACGEDIQNGNYTWEKDDITRRGLSKLIGTPGYIKEQIQKCISEGPLEASKEYKAEQDTPGLKENVEGYLNIYEIWYHYGMISKTNLLAIDILSGKEDLEEYEDEYLNVHLTMVNNRVIKASLSHIEDGEFPYDLMVWQRRMGMPWGIGVARQIRPAQRMVIGAVRHMMDNAGIAGGPMVFIDTNVVQAAEGTNEVKPWKIFIPANEYENSGPDKSNVSEAIQFITAPMMQVELQSIIELGLRMAEDITGMPDIMRGQTNSKTPDTLGGMQLQSNNASTVLRRMARLYDDYITIPHIQRYYQYILEYVDDDSMKGDVNVQALGSSSLVERDIADQAIMGMSDLVMNPVFKKDPAKWIDEMFRINKINPAKLDYDDEEWKALVEQLSSPPPDPKLEIAQMKVQSDQQMAQFKVDAQTKLEQIKIQAEQQMAQFQAQTKERLIQIENQISAQTTERAKSHEATLLQYTKELEASLKQMQEAGSDKRHMQTIKKDLQDTVMKLKVQIQLNDREVSNPLVEPAGRAPDGESYSK
ncbi:MAG: hypothetical protein COA78_12110 [Blastopirellula sp.]|nr:MAG: hypothetical protein COA78_12110 [Blastopirellula sp.]